MSTQNHEDSTLDSTLESQQSVAASMLPDSSPGQPKTGVRRVNNMPLILMGTAGVLFVGVLGLVAMKRADDQRAQSEPQAQAAPAGKGAGPSTASFAKDIAGEARDGLVQPKALAVGDLADPAAGADAASAASGVLVARSELDKPPTPTGGGKGQSSGLQPADNGGGHGGGALVGDDPFAAQERERIRQVKAQLMDEAVKGKTAIRFDAARSSGSSPSSINTPLTRDEAAARMAALRQQAEAAKSEDPTTAYKQRLAQLQNAGVIGGGGGASAGGAAPQLLQTSSAGGKGYNQFSGNGQADRWKLDSQVEAPHSPYELRTGFVLPATLISGINSDLSGQIMAQVSQNVYDTATGKFLLVPLGSRLVGTYGSDVAYGQSRVLIAWQRIIFPDGKAMDIGAMPGADQAGYAGFSDQVNNHLIRLFGSAFLMSGVTAGVALSQPQATNSNGRPTASSAMSEALGQQLGQVTAQLIAKNLNIAPTLEIRPGFRFNVMVTKDMVFSKPYRSFDY